VAGTPTTRVAEARIIAMIVADVLVEPVEMI
jgi:hypothetical protein